jgi:glyoxylase-like metal-dependent hydrolase (beta-lactamase superfamily II)
MGKSPRHLPQPFHFLMQRFLRYEPVPAGTIHSVGDEEELDILGGVRALATPGHTEDHFAFHSPTTGALFAGDALSSRGKVLHLPSGFITADQEAARRSARRLLSLTPALFACGHGPPLRDHTLRDLMVTLQELK